MLREIIINYKVVMPVEDLDNNKEVVASAIVNRLLKSLAFVKACEHGYLLSVTKLVGIGSGDFSFGPRHVIIPVDFGCRIFTPVNGEVLTGFVHKIYERGVFLKSGPMSMVYLSARKMPSYHFVMGENPAFVREDSSKIEPGVVIRYAVFAVRWVEDRRREFRVLASIDADDLGPVSLNGFDGIDL